MDITNSKRLMLIYVTVLLWLFVGVLGAYKTVPFQDLTVYFLSLTGFVASYIWGESVRPADATSILKKGKNSSREVLIYICILIWAIFGTFVILKKVNLSLVDLAAYYSSLTPFVSAYILGVTYKPENKNAPSTGA